MRPELDKATGKHLQNLRNGEVVFISVRGSRAL